MLIWAVRDVVFDLIIFHYANEFNYRFYSDVMNLIFSLNCDSRDHYVKTIEYECYRFTSRVSNLIRFVEVLFNDYNLIYLIKF